MMEASTFWAAFGALGSVLGVVVGLLITSNRHVRTEASKSRKELFDRIGEAENKIGNLQTELKNYKEYCNIADDMKRILTLLERREAREAA